MYRLPGGSPLLDEFRAPSLPSSVGSSSSSFFVDGNHSRLVIMVKTVLLIMAKDLIVISICTDLPLFPRLYVIYSFGEDTSDVVKCL